MVRRRIGFAPVGITTAVMLACGIALAACQPSHYAVTQDRAYSPSEFHYATANKDVRTVIRGNPFDGPKDRLEAVILDAMQPVNWGFEGPYTPRTRFTTQPDGSANENYRIEVSFRRDDLAAPAAICAGGGGGDSSSPSTAIVARMAFCYQDRLLSTTVGHLDSPEGVYDPRFHRLIARMTRDLFPQRDFREGDVARRNARFGLP